MGQKISREWQKSRHEVNTYLKIITESPGIHFRGIMRKTGLMNGVLSYHIGSLERKKLIVANRGSRTSQFYPNDISVSDFASIQALRKHAPRLLLLALLYKGNLSFAQLVPVSGRSQPTVSMHLARLVRDGIVEVRTVRTRKFYSLTDKMKIDRLIDDYGSGMFDTYAANFEDAVNTLRL